jgi:lipopolysaccharide biosynthesis regulator YciM
MIVITKWRQTMSCAETSLEKMTRVRVRRLVLQATTELASIAARISRQQTDSPSFVLPARTQPDRLPKGSLLLTVRIMNAQENAAAHELLDQIKQQARTIPDVARKLAEAYKLICEAAATRPEK